MATIGQTLTSPEVGWKRYESNHPLFVRGGAGSWTEDVHSNYSGGSTVYSSTSGNSISFVFSGSKIRLIAYTATNHTNNVSVSINGTSEIVSLAYSGGYQILSYDKQLGNGVHTVVITNNRPSMFMFDAIDIDSTGRLFHPDEVTDPKDLAIGKRIRCNYKSATSGQVGTFSGLGLETKDFIPLASSATPNGDFYYIMVEDWNGEKRLIADRNIQHSISWDVLNSAGIASGSGLPTRFYGSNMIPKMTLNTAPSGTASASAFYESAYDAWKAFDGVLNQNQGWLTPGNTLTGWLSYDFGNPRVITAYSISPYGLDKSPKTWTFEGWNGSAWVVLDTRSNVTSFNVGGRTIFSFSNIIEYSKYRLNITAVNGTVNIGISELEMFDTHLLANDFNFTTRLLTGGTTSTDKDNEWDKYIVNSTLGGTITAGNNGVWNAILGASLTSTTGSNSISSERVRRGEGNISSWYSNTNTSIANSTSTNFRPVLEVESLFTLLNKSFILSGGEYKKWSDKIAGEMTQDLTYSGEGKLLRFPLSKKAKKVEVN